MKKTIFAMAAMLAMGSAFATGPSLVQSGATVSSNVSGSTGSYSQATGVNQFSAHGSFAAANNATCVDGSTTQGRLLSGGVTSATSTGSTLTAAGGFGNGGSDAYASQSGFGNITLVVNNPTWTSPKVNQSFVSSTAGVGTFSYAENVNSGAALSGSLAGATNVSLVGVSASICGWSICTKAAGITGGADSVKTFGGTVGSNESVDAGGTWSFDGGPKNVGSFQNGSFSGNVKVVNAPL